MLPPFCTEASPVKEPAVNILTFPIVTIKVIYAGLPQTDAGTNKVD